MTEDQIQSTIITLDSIDAVDRLARGLSFISRPKRVRLSTSLLPPTKRRQLERDLSACGCGTGSAAALLALLALVTFGRGEWTWQLALGWFAAVAAATLLGKLAALFITYVRARRTLRSVRTSLMQEPTESSHERMPGYR